MHAEGGECEVGAVTGRALTQGVEPFLTRRFGFVLVPIFGALALPASAVAVPRPGASGKISSSGGWGSYTIRITASGAGKTHSTTATLQVKKR
jgi:hypothetical protein